MVSLGQVLLVGVIAVPALGAALVPALPDRFARPAAVAVAALTFAASLGLFAGRRDPAPGAVVDPWHEVDIAWVPSLGLRLHLGVDGISAPLVVLTALLVLLCAVYTLKVAPGPGRVPTLLAMLLVLDAGIIGVFCALDLLLFFVLFETTLLPMYAVIRVWGGAGRAHAAAKFVLYTLLGSVLLLVGLVVLGTAGGTGDVVALSEAAGDGIGYRTQMAAFVLLALAFAVKSPLWPLHTWLPDAHTEAPTVGSVLLAGVLLKLGTYGLVRLAVPTLPEATRAAAPVIAVLAVAAIGVAAFVCLAMDDLKRLIAYSSVGHMGFVLLGIATLSAAGLQAALIGNVAHGVVTGLLFFLAGAIKDAHGTGRLSELGGLGSRAPWLAGVLTLAAVASLGLPGLAGFWGEAFAVVGAWRPAEGLPSTLYTVLAVLAALGAALTAAYFLRLLRRVVAPAEGSTSVPVSVSVTEWVAWAPLIALAVVLGFAPWLVTAVTGPAVDALLPAVAR